ncbi:MAG: sensor histidine kinase [Rubrivivax sp.]
MPATAGAAVPERTVDDATAGAPCALVLADAEQAEPMARQLLAQGWLVVRGTASGEPGGAHAGQAQPDAVFVDAAAVRVHGPAACRRARQRWLPQGGALFVFGHAADDEAVEPVEAMLAEGASDWLRLPLGEALLAARLRPYLELARLRRLTDAQQGRLQSLQGALRAQEPLATLGMLGASLAHEVSNPNNFVQLSADNLRHELGRFRAHLDTLLDDDADPEIRADFQRRFERLEQHIGLVNDGCRHIAEVVQAVRSQARPGAGVDVEEDVDVAEVLERSLRLVKVAFGQAVRFAPELRDRALVRCSRGAMQQVFVNLLVNACQAIEARAADGASREPGVVRAVSRLQGGSLCLGVLDDGCGMEAEVQQRLFEPFFTTKGAARGTGLGMGICREVVQGMGGDIAVRSQPGRGTEIWLTLPVAPGGGG